MLFTDTLATNGMIYIKYFIKAENKKHKQDFHRFLSVLMDFRLYSNLTKAGKTLSFGTRYSNHIYT